MANKKLDLEEAKRILKQSNTPGFRKANKKLLREAEAVVKEDFINRGEAFMADYRELCKKHGMEIKAEMQPVEGMPRNIAKAGLMLDEYVEKKPKQIKPWSEAAAENLETRKKCEHKLNAEGNVCEKCGAAPQNWHESGTGVTEQYEQESLERIKEWQAEEVEETASDEPPAGGD